MPERDNDNDSDSDGWHLLPAPAEGKFEALCPVTIEYGAEECIETCHDAPAQSTPAPLPAPSPPTPPFDVRVIGARVVIDTAAYITYFVETCCRNGEKYVVRRRYREFLDLYRSLCVASGQRAIAGFPHKTFHSVYDTALIDERKTRLEGFLRDATLLSERFGQMPRLFRFLTM